MAVIGCLGDVAFVASAATVRTITGAVWSGSARYSTHKRVGTDALTEFTGRDPDGFTFDLVLSAFLGVDPMSDIVKLWNYERTGEALPLIIGDKGYGKYRWVITAHKVKMQTFGADGALLSATVSVTLLEYLRR